jgi:hypothetical protein
MEYHYELETKIYSTILGYITMGIYDYILSQGQQIQNTMGSIEFLTTIFEIYDDDPL